MDAAIATGGHIGALAVYASSVVLPAALPFCKKIFNYATGDFQTLMAEQNELLKQLLAERPK